MNVSVTDLLLLGKENAVGRLYLATMTKMDERLVRKIINKLRLSGAPIISGQQGFWLSDDPAELEEFSRSMQHRAGEIARVADAVQRTADRLRGQERMEGW